MKMQAVMVVMEKALPVFMMLALGVLMCRKKAISRDGISAMKYFVVNITLPAVMFSAFATAEYTARSIWVPLLIFGACVFMLVLGKGICKAMNVPGKLSPYLATGFEAGMLGYALFALLFPQESAASFAIVDLGQVLFVFTVYKAMLAGKGGLKGIVHEAVHAPTVWAIVLGILFGATGLYRALEPSGVSGILDAVTAFAAAPTSAVILFTIGYDLVSGTIQWHKTVKLVGLRVIVAGIALCAVMLLDRMLLGGLIHSGALILMFTLPPPYVLPVFADVEEERADISSTLSALTVVSLVLFMVLTGVF